MTISCDIVLHMATWAVLDRGDVPEGAQARLIEFTCIHCGFEGDIPVLGLPLAQVGQGIVFDRQPYAMPKTIRCRYCRRTFEVEP